MISAASFSKLAFAFSLPPVATTGAIRYITDTLWQSSASYNDVLNRASRRTAHCHAKLSAAMSPPEVQPETPTHKRRRFRLTSAWLVFAVFVAEAFLILSELLGWSPFRWPKGWPALICLATVAVLVLLFALSFAVSLIFRWRFQFSLRSLLALMLVVAIACGWLATGLESARRQRDLVAKASALGCGVLYDYNLSESGEVSWFTGARPGETRLNELLGDDFFHEVVGAQPRTDDALRLFQRQTSLRWLDFSNSQVTDAGLESLERLTQLEWLDLRDASKTADEGLKHIRGLTRLRHLLLRRTNVTDAGMVYLKDLKELQVLDLGMTHVTNIGLQNLAGLTRLRQLSFWGNKIEDAGLVYVQPMTELEILELGGAPVTDAGLNYFVGLTRLRSLNLRGSRVTDAGLRHLKGLRQLRELDLFGTRVSDAGLDDITGLVHLEILRLGESQVTAAAMKRLQQALPNCKIEM